MAPPNKTRGITSKEVDAARWNLGIPDSSMTTTEVIRRGWVPRKFTVTIPGAGGIAHDMKADSPGNAIFLMGRRESSAVAYALPPANTGLSYHRPECMDRYYNAVCTRDINHIGPHVAHLHHAVAIAVWGHGVGGVRKLLPTLVAAQKRPKVKAKGGE